MYESIKTRQQLMTETGTRLVINEFITRPEECQKLLATTRQCPEAQIERGTRSNSNIAYNLPDNDED